MEGLTKTVKDAAADPETKILGQKRTRSSSKSDDNNDDRAINNSKIQETQSSDILTPSDVAGAAVCERTDDEEDFVDV